MSSTLKFLTADSLGKTLFYDIWDNASTKPQTSLSPEMEDYYLKQVKKKATEKIRTENEENIRNGGRRKTSSGFVV